jgi:hypothetical protein
VKKNGKKVKCVAHPAPLLFKVLVDGKPCSGGTGEYPKPGVWTKKRVPKCCGSG